MSIPAAIQRVTADTAVVAGHGTLLYAVAVAASTAAVVNVRDGGSSDTIVLTLRVPVDTTEVFTPPVPASLSTGLYIEIASGAGEVTVVYG